MHRLIPLAALVLLASGCRDDHPVERCVDGQGFALPEQGIRTTRMFGGYWILDTPARSAPAYEHQLQRIARILGCQSLI